MKFLIVKTSSVGDIIQTFPVLEYLKTFFSQAEIDWVVEEEYLSLIESHPLVHRGIAFNSKLLKNKKLLFLKWRQLLQFFRELRSKRYDILFDLQGNIKSSLITAAARTDKKVGLGWKSVAEFPNFFVTQQHIDVVHSSQIQTKYLQLVQQFFGDQNPFLPEGVNLILSFQEKKALEKMLVKKKPRYMVACFSKWQNKQLKEDTLRQFLNKVFLEDSPYFYFIWGTPKERAVAQRLHRFFPASQTLGALPFPLWQALMREMDLVIAVDSAALALCGTTKTPSLSFFGPSREEVYRPLGSQHTSWQGSCPYGISFEFRCPFLRRCPSGDCLKKGSIEQFLEAYLNYKKHNLSGKKKHKYDE